MYIYNSMWQLQIILLKLEVSRNTDKMQGKDIIKSRLNRQDSN